jgi:proteasome accessory factor B
VVVLVRSGSGHGLRRDATNVESGVRGPDGTEGWDRLRVQRGSGAADEFLSYGASVYVESPAALREDIIGRLSALFEGAAP